MRKSKLRLALAIVLIAMVLSSAIVLADSWKYCTEITIRDNSGGARASVPVIISTLRGQNLIDAGYVDSNATNTAMKEGTTARDFLIATEETLVAIPSLAATQQRTYKLYMGYSPSTEFDIITGTGGYVTTSDNSLLELGNSFEIELTGFVNASAGSNKDLIYKQDAFRLYINAENSLRAAILSDGDAEVVTVTSAITTEKHKVKVIADMVNLKLYLDDVEKASSALGANSVPDNSNSWIFMRNDVAAELDYVKIQK